MSTRDVWTRGVLPSIAKGAATAVLAGLMGFMGSWYGVKERVERNELEIARVRTIAEQNRQAIYGDGGREGLREQLARIEEQIRAMRGQLARD